MDSKFAKAYVVQKSLSARTLLSEICLAKLAKNDF